MGSKYSIDELTQLVTAVLENSGAARAMAEVAARALVAAEAEGLGGHGLSRAPLYAQHLREGRVNGKARVSIKTDKGATCLISAGGGLAFEAVALAVIEAINRSKQYGVAFCGVTDSHHSGAMDYHLAPVAQAGLVGLAFTNSPAAINAWGGKRPLFGTNPIAAAFPRKANPPLVIDLSLTEVVRGKIMLYAKEGKPIPLGWAVDRDGKPTTDAKAALTGSLFAIGGAKGAMLALMVELLCVALTGAAFAYENDSYFEPGNRPRIGHAIVAIDPAALAGSDVYFERVETLIAAMLSDEGVRLPGDRRHKLAADARANGIEVPDALLKQLRDLSESSRVASRAQPVDCFVTVNGLRIHYLEWGTSGGQPLVLLHGIARVAHNFDHLAPHFGEKYHVIAVDMRGHGDSAWDPQGAYLVEDYVRDIEGLIERLKLRNIVLWGNSTGGRVAQVFAGSHPDLVSAVIVEDVGPERPAAISSRRANRMSQEENGWASLDELLAQVAKDYPRSAEPVLRSFAQHGSKPRADGRVVWKRDPAILNGFVPTELWATVSRIKAPVIYILGGASDIVPPATQDQLRQTLPQVEIVTMPGLGHYPSDEKPADFLAIVDRFLAAAESR